MNGNWYPWSGAVGKDSPARYVTMWRRVHGSFRKQGVDTNRLQWVWSVNRQDIGGVKVERYYPGNAYVDWTAIDGYNRIPEEQPSGWSTPGQVFDTMLARIRRISSRPVAITETASTAVTPTGVDLAAKNTWIGSLYDYVLAKDIRMICWFNQDKIGDGPVFGGGRGDGSYQGRLVFGAFPGAVSRPQFRSSDLANPRLLTDGQFKGSG